MAREQKDPQAPFQAHAPAHEVGHAMKAGAGGGSYVVTFPGCAPVTVTAASEEEAVKKAAAEQGVVSSEKPPDVVAVP